MGALDLKPAAHVVDVLGNVVGRDQPILRMDKALEMVSLLGEEIFADDNVVFFDPFCKAGELLLACAFLSCKAKEKKSALSIDSVKNEIYGSNRYFGLAPDERHHKLSVRTFLGNKNSHDEKFNHIIRDGHYLSEQDGNLDKEKFEKEFEFMISYIKQKAGAKRIVAIGNPPYQEDYTGSESNTGANLVYHYFLDRIIKSGEIEEFIVVIPSRWFAGGRGKSFKEFFSELRKTKKIKQVYDFPDSKTVFPTVEIKGGVCFLHWDKKHFGDTTFFNHTDKTSEQVDLSSGQVVVREAAARTILSKVQEKSSKFISEIAWSWNPFNLPSNYFDKNEEDKKGNVFECYTKRGVVKKISKNKISKNKESVGKFKIVYPKAISDGGIPHRPDQIFILGPDQICTETYMVIDVFESKKEAESLLKYLQTDFVRFLVSVKKITQDMTKDTWCLVPQIDIKKLKTEDDIFKAYGLSSKEITFIKEKAKEWK